jgi:hypothetical protein
MRPLHELMLETMREERRRLASRRGFLKGGVKLAAGGTLALATFGMPGFSRLTVRAQDFDDDIDVLNYALTLEHLENAFYRDLGDQFDLGTDAFNQSIGDRIAAIGEHEAAHVETLIVTIETIGGTAVEEAEYDFGVTDAATFLATAAALENTGVSAFDGAGQFLESADLLTAAGTIVAVEARHASYLNLITGVLPFPAAFETPLTPEEVLEIAGPFIVTGEATPGADEGEATPEA